MPYSWPSHHSTNRRYLLMEEEYTPDPNGCCETSAKERVAKGHGPFSFGTTGYVKWWQHKAGYVPGVVLADTGTCCGGEDDIKIAYKHDWNEWGIGWFDAYDFTPYDFENEDEVYKDD
jgi:hypothetical protein